MNQDFLEKWLIPGLQLWNYKMILKHFVAPESKEVCIKKIQQLGIVAKLAKTGTIWALK